MNKEVAVSRDQDGGLGGEGSAVCSLASYIRA
jgi:hypothetical protein